MCVIVGSGGGVVYMVCLYILFIRVAGLVKVFRGFRFDVELYAGFKRVACEGGCTVTGAFERFMSCCVEGGGLVFPEGGTAGFEAEARVLVDWLGKGRRFYRGEGGVEVNISGRLVWLLLRVRDAKLRGEIEVALKGSVSGQE